jgi:cytochrome P450
MMVICDMLGVPSEDRDSFRSWTATLAATLEPFPSGPVQDAADEAIVAFIDYFRGLIADRRANLSDDLLSALIEAEQAGDRLDEHELILTSLLLLAAGFETTTNLIGNGTLALLCNREQWQKLVDQPELASRAVEELLRYDSPVQLATPRVARTEVEVDGGVMQEGEIMIPAVGAGNRDPDRFPEPQKLDVTREDVVPLSFGGGPHFCLGASLARMEGAALFECLPARIPTLDLEEQEPRWRPTMNIRGLESLAVKA